MLGYETILSTGTDEHGNKVENAAKAAKLPVKDYCQDVSSQFRKMSDQFDIGYTYFVRTTDEKHRQTVQEFWVRFRFFSFFYCFRLKLLDKKVNSYCRKNSGIEITYI